MCLLHGDFHRMSAECWEVAIEAYLTWPADGAEAPRDRYQREVERAMLARLVAACRTTSP